MDHYKLCFVAFHLHPESILSLDHIILHCITMFRVGLEGLEDNRKVAVCCASTCKCHHKLYFTWLGKTTPFIYERVVEVELLVLNCLFMICWLLNCCYDCLECWSAKHGWGYNKEHEFVVQGLLFVELSKVLSEIPTTLGLCFCWPTTTYLCQVWAKAKPRV